MRKFADIYGCLLPLHANIIEHIEMQLYSNTAYNLPRLPTYNCTDTHSN